MHKEFVIGEYVKCVGEARTYLGQIISSGESDYEECDYVVRIIHKVPRNLSLTEIALKEFDYCDCVNYELFNLIKIDQTYGKQRFEEKKLELL